MIELLKVVGAVIAILVIAALMTYLAQHLNRKDNPHE